MRNIHSIVFFVVLLMATSCNTTKYISDSLNNVNANQYETYVLEDHCAEDINPIMQIRIKNAVELDLRDKGLEYDEKADLLIKYFVKNKTQKYVQECSDDYNRWEGGTLCRDQVITYDEGTLVMDMIDTRTNSIIWHGAAYGPSWSSLRNPNEKVTKTVMELMDRFFYKTD